MKSFRCDYPSYFINRKISNETSETVNVQIGSKTYLIPENSSFYLTSVESLVNFPELRNFDLIYIDPPWRNKSVKRGKKYSSHDMDIVKNLQLPSRKRAIVIWNWRIRKYSDSWLHWPFVGFSKFKNRTKTVGFCKKICKKEPKTVQKGSEIILMF